MRSYTITYNVDKVIKIMAIDAVHARAKANEVIKDIKIVSTVITKPDESKPNKIS